MKDSSENIRLDTFNALKDYFKSVIYDPDISKFEE